MSIIIVGQGILDKDLLLLSLTFVGAGAQAQETAVFTWNNGKEVPSWGVAEIQKMSP